MLPVAVICKFIVYPGLYFGLRGQESIHLHHKVAGTERNPSNPSIFIKTQNQKALLQNDPRVLLMPNNVPVFLSSKLLDFAFDSLSGCFQDDVLQKQEVILVKNLLPL